MTLRKNQNGSATLGALAAVTALSVTWLYVVGLHSKTANTLQLAKNAREREAKNLGAMSSLSRYKGLLAPKKQADGKSYIPSIYATNYFAPNWNLKQGNGSPVKVNDNKTSLPVSDQNIKESDIGRLLTGDMSMAKDNFQIDLVKPHRSEAHKMAVDYVTVVVSNMQKANGKDTRVELGGNIPMTVPVPIDYKIVYRKPGSGEYKELTAKDELTDGPYEFAARASGVVYDANIWVDGKDIGLTLGGVNPKTGLVDHEAVSYDVKDGFVGPAVTYNPTVKPPDPTTRTLTSTSTSSSSGGSDSSGSDSSSGSKAGTGGGPYSTDGTTCGIIKGNLNGGASGGSGGSDSDTVTTTTTTTKITATVIPASYKRTATFKLIVRAADETEYPGDEIKVKVMKDPPPPTVSVSTSTSTSKAAGDSKKPGGRLTLDDYANKCTSQCAYRGEDPVGGVLGGAAAFEHNTNDLSSSFTFTEGQNRWGVYDQKVCYNFARGNNGSGTYNEHDTDIVMYDTQNCKRTFLFQRGECGCLAPDTLITLGDGVTQKRIDQLTQDDKLWNPIEGRAYPILKMTRGPEKKPMYRLHVGREVIEATEFHPFITADGVKAASRLAAGELIKTEDWGRIDSIEVLPVPEEAPIVWNLELDTAGASEQSAHYIMANGVVTGDLAIQQRIQAGETIAAP